MSKKLTTEEFIHNAKAIHKEYYDYSKVEYVTGNDKVEVVCKTHESFFVTPGNHTSRKSGCPTCASLATGKRLKETTQGFNKKALAVHGDTYGYSKVTYGNSNTDKVIITCKIHGDFLQTPKDHLGKKAGCPECGRVRSTNAAWNTQEEFINNAKAIHGNNYRYDKVEYTGISNLVEIYCSNCNMYFTQKPVNHTSGHGCSACASTGFDTTKPAILYYLSINNGMAYKIGITNSTVQKRFGSDMPKITILKIWEYPLGVDAYKKEQEIINLYKDYKYAGQPLLQNGNTELFTIDILDLDEVSRSTVSLDLTIDTIK